MSRSYSRGVSEYKPPNRISPGHAIWNRTNWLHRSSVAESPAAGTLVLKKNAVYIFDFQ